MDEVKKMFKEHYKCADEVHKERLMRLFDVIKNNPNFVKHTLEPQEHLYDALVTHTQAQDNVRENILR